MSWTWDGPTIIGLAMLVLAVLGVGGRLCHLMKLRIRDDAVIHERIDKIEEKLK